MHERLVKSGFSSLGVIAAYYFDKITPLFWLLILFEAADYITGIMAAFKTGTLSSRDATLGFMKKVCYFFLVSVAFGMDYLILEITPTIGLDVDFPPVFGMFSILYLISTEAISILENISEFGVKVPFLDKVLKTIRNKISEKGGGE